MDSVSKQKRTRYLLTLLILITIPCYALGIVLLKLNRVPGESRVLAVEDNLLNREVVVELLGAVDLASDMAGDGLEALDKARAAHYDLILMDLQMPRLDGIGATRAIRLLPGYKDTPIIALTANAYSEDRRNAIAAGMNDFVAKPVSPEQLYAVLARWLPGAKA